MMNVNSESPGMGSSAWAQRRLLGSWRPLLTGLGVSRGVAEAMGGTLTPERTPGGGLTMTLSLPVALAPIGTQPAQPGRREREQATLAAQ